MQSLFGKQAPKSPEKQQNHMIDDPIELPPKKEQAKTSTPYDLQTKLSLTIKTQKKIVKLNSKEEQLLPVLVNVKTEDLTEEQEGERASIDLICVIDRSGSMQGQKIELVKKTLKTLLQMTSKYDRICLIQYQNTALQLTPLLRNTPQNLQHFLSKIEGISATGGTDIGSGMKLAFDVIKNRKSANPVTSIFLLTDGLDGGADIKIQKHLLASDIMEQPFTINCFGFGKDHDEQLMVKIAKIQDGNFYYVEKLDTIDQAFADAIGGLMTVVALQTSIYVKHAAFKPFDGIQIKKTFGDKWVKKGATSGYEIKLTQLLAGVEKGYIAQLSIPPLDVTVSDKQRSVLVLDVNLIAIDKEGKTKIEKNAQLVLHIINQNQELGDVEEDGQVLQNYFRVKGAQSIQEAMKDADSGQYDQGKDRLQKMAHEIASNKNINQQKMKPLLQQLKESEETCEHKAYNYGGKKAMMEKGYGIMEQKAMSNNIYKNKGQERMVNEMRAKK